jgi:hypothetical protein
MTVIKNPIDIPKKTQINNKNLAEEGEGKCNTEVEDKIQINNKIVVIEGA